MNIENLKEKIIQNKKILLVILISLITVLTLVVTYSFYSPIIMDFIGTDINADVGYTDNLQFVEGEALSLTHSSGNFGEGDGFLSSSTTSKAILTVGTDENKTLNDTYYVYFQINENTYQYTSPSNSAELILTITDPDGNEVTSIDGLTHTTVTDVVNNSVISGFDVTTFVGEIHIASNYTITTTSSTTHNWTAKLTYVNLDTNQYLNQDAVFDGKLLLTTEKIIIYTGMAKDLIENHNEAEHGLIQHSSDIEMSAGDNNYRYSGGDNLVQNNYVCFGSDEETCPSANLYRIIGIYDGSVKLTTASLLPNRPFDSGNDNRWEGADVNNASDDADINIYLNGEYLNGMPSKYLDMIKDHNYNIGAVISDSTYKPKDFYEEEIITKTTQTYKIGLMNPSDYLYASNKTNWSLYNYESNSSTNDYNGSQNKNINNWLLHGDIYWTINPKLSDFNFVWDVDNGGYAFSSDDASYDFGVVPVLYLETNVKILNGNGTQIEPFRVGL